MICRLSENILNKIAAHKLYTESDNSSSWFVLIRQLCHQYALPSPLFLLANPPPKQTFKTLVKKKILDYWQRKYRAEALEMESLPYFKPQFMSLRQPHPLWTTCQNNTFEVNKSIAVARLLSGRYRSDWHCRHWSQTNKEGFCLLCPGKNLLGNIEHLIIDCTALDDKRNLLFKFWSQQAKDSPHLQHLVSTMRASPHNKFVQLSLIPPSWLKSSLAVKINTFLLMKSST